MNVNKMCVNDISSLVKLGEYSAVDIVKSMYEYTEKNRKNSGIYVTQMKKNALEAAKKVDSEKSDMPLAGVPVGVQDNICIDGTLTTCGSKMLYNFTSPYTATVVDRLCANGAVVLGKTNLDEFGISSTGETSYFGAVKNPHNSEYVAGGASSGSAAGVASGEMTLALGTSVMQSAAHCGVVGFQPSYGTVSRYGAVLPAPSMDGVGIVGRSVKDVAALLSVIAGKDKKDPRSVDVDYSSLLKGISSFDMNGVKIAKPIELYSGTSADIVSAVDACISRMTDNGASLSEVNVPSMESVLSVHSILSAAEIASEMYKYDGISFGYHTETYNGLDEFYEKTRSEGFGDFVKHKILLGMYVLSSDNIDAVYNKARTAKEMLVCEYNEIFKTSDVIITPTTLTTAPKLGEFAGDVSKQYDMNVYTAVADLLGAPTVTVPCGKDKNGLPIGVHIMGKKYSDQLVLGVANYFENLVGGFDHSAII